MSIILKLDNSKIKINERNHRLEVPIGMTAAARVLEIAREAKNGLILEINKYYPPRSNQANKKMWAVCRQIAEEMSKEFSITDIEIYQKAIRDGNEYQDIDIPNDELEERMRMWGARGIGWFSEEMSPAPEGGKVTVRQYYGSSSYNSRQMSALIRRLIDDAANIGLRIEDPAVMALLSDEDMRYVTAAQNAM